MACVLSNSEARRWGGTSVRAAWPIYPSEKTSGARSETSRERLCAHEGQVSPRTNQHTTAHKLDLQTNRPRRQTMVAPSFHLVNRRYARPQRICPLGIQDVQGFMGFFECTLPPKKKTNPSQSQTLLYPTVTLWDVSTFTPSELNTSLLVR